VKVAPRPGRRPRRRGDARVVVGTTQLRHQLVGRNAVGKQIEAVPSLREICRGMGVATASLPVPTEPQRRPPGTSRRQRSPMTRNLNRTPRSRRSSHPPAPGIAPGPPWARAPLRPRGHRAVEPPSAAKLASNSLTSPSQASTHRSPHWEGATKCQPADYKCEGRRTQRCLTRETVLSRLSTVPILS
jgi:hypothetical protein